MDKFFSLFGEIVLVIVIAGVLIAGGVYIGKKYNLPFIPTNQTTTPSASVMVTTSVNPSTAVSPTVFQQQADPHLAINGGGIDPFNRYLMSGFKSWTKTVDHTSTSDKLTLTLGDYQLIILQAAFGGGPCIFPGQQPQAMSVVLTNPVADIQMFDGSVYKRGQADPGTNPGKATYTVCQPKEGSYSTITSFGVITYIVPRNPDSETVAMMDAMVGSLQKQ